MQPSPKPKRVVQPLLIVPLIMAAIVAALGTNSNSLDNSQVHYAYVPVISGSQRFTYGTSRYMSTTNVSKLKTLGCTQGQATPTNTTALVVLDFYEPAYNGSTFGTYIYPGSPNFRGTGDISTAAEAYLNSFYLCSPQGAYLQLAVGTVNYYRYTGSGINTTAMAYAHGAAWARMINDIAAWIAAPPSIASKVTVRGGNDMEPGFGSPVMTRAWVDGYTSAFTGTSFLYNYGSCDSCPFKTCTGCTPTNGWTLDDLWYVSWGALPAYPVPEIYETGGAHADQWYRMSLYGYTRHGQAFDFKGTLTQWQACQTNGPCRTLANTPVSGWSQLYEKVNADSRTRQKYGLASDISWGN